MKMMKKICQRLEVKALKNGEDSPNERNEGEEKMN